MRSRGFLRGCDLSRSRGCRETDSCGELRGSEEGEEREEEGTGTSSARGEGKREHRIERRIERKIREVARGGRGVKMAG